MGYEEKNLQKSQDYLSFLDRARIEISNIKNTEETKASDSIIRYKVEDILEQIKLTEFPPGEKEELIEEIEKLKLSKN